MLCGFCDVRWVQPSLWLASKTCMCCSCCWVRGFAAAAGQLCHLRRATRDLPVQAQHYHVLAGQVRMRLSMHASSCQSVGRGALSMPEPATWSCRGLGHLVACTSSRCWCCAQLSVVSAYHSAIMYDCRCIPPKDRFSMQGTGLQPGSGTCAAQRLPGTSRRSQILADRHQG